VCLRIDIRIDAKGNRRAPAELPGNGVDALHFGFRFEVQAEHAGFEREPDFGCGLADTREQDFARVATRHAHAIQFS